MRVLEVADFYLPWVGGPARLVESLSTGLTRMGHDVSIVAPSPTGPCGQEDTDPPVFRVKTWPVPFGYNLRAGAPFLAMRKLLRETRPEVVHIHHPFPISLAALVAARERRIPVVATNHTIPACALYGIRDTRAYPLANEVFWWYLKRLLRSVAVVVTPTQTAADLLTNAHFDKPVDVISNGIDLDRFQPAIKRNSPDGTPTVLFSGRLDPEKELDTLIDAIPDVLSQVRANFRLGGEGVEQKRLVHKVEALGLADRVTFTGYVDDAELPGVYQSASLYVMPSPVELQSITTLEAAASGLPVVAVNASALPELVHDGKNGYLTPPGDAKRFAQAIVRILSDATLSAAMANESRAIAMEHSVVNMVNRYEEVFGRVIREHGIRDKHPVPVVKPAA